MTKGSTWSILCCRLMHVPHTGCNVRFGSKADMCGAQAHVRFVPKADINGYSITSSAVASSDCGMARPSVFAVLRLTTSSYLVGASADTPPPFTTQ